MLCHKAQYNPSTIHHSFFMFKYKQPPTSPLPKMKPTFVGIKRKNIMSRIRMNSYYLK